MLVDKKILAGGVSMIVVGMILSGVLADMTPIGRYENSGELLIKSRFPKLCNVSG